MVSYYIGLHETFDKTKYEKDFTEHISGIELCNFSSSSAVEEIYNLSLKGKFQLGIHFPLLESSYKYRDPLVTSNKQSEVEEAFMAIEKELKVAKDIGVKKACSFINAINLASAGNLLKPNSISISNPMMTRDQRVCFLNDHFLFILYFLSIFPIPN
jgi:hypothetical protein